MTITKPVMRYHGGKFRMAPWVIAHFPPHVTYCEPFGGAAGVLMQKPRSEHEVYNDLDEDTVNVFRVLRDPERAASLKRLCAATPYSRREFELAYNSDADDPVERARKTLVRAMQGFGSAGATKGRTGFRSYSGGSGRAPNPSIQWSLWPDAVEQFTMRLAGVVIECKPAVEMMRIHDSESTLHYVDPPYLPDTRVMGRYYRHEMTRDQHAELLDSLAGLQGMVALSGYDDALYHDCLAGWRLSRRKSAASGRYGSVTREECLWINPVGQQAAQQQDMFVSEVTA